MQCDTTRNDVHHVQLQGEGNVTSAGTNEGEETDEDVEPEAVTDFRAKAVEQETPRPLPSCRCAERNAVNALLS